MCVRKWLLVALGLVLECWMVGCCQGTAVPFVADVARPLVARSRPGEDWQRGPCAAVTRGLR